MSLAGPEVQPGGAPADSSAPEQGELLLSTKLYVPPLRANRIPRPHLFEQLNRGLDQALILVSAPAGYGKTTLVSGWLHETGTSAAWLSLDEADNDPIRFLSYLLTALHKVVPGIRPDLLGLLQDNQPAAYKYLVNIVINHLAECAFPLVLVLDEFQTIYAPSVLELLTHLLEHLPPQAHVVILSRTDPPLPLARLRVRNQVLEIRAGQLRFTHAEITRFLNGVMGLEISAQDILALEARTEGWVAGLQLASIALQTTLAQTHLSNPDRANMHAFVSAFTGSHYYIMDYLAEEVLKSQPESVRTFLLQSSILDRMCGPLCEEVLAGDQPGPVDGQAMLETLDQMNLFIIPLDSQRRWYRYHRLFAEVLNRRLEQSLPKQLLPDLHRRAARWYEHNGYFFDAIRHTLLAGDQARAAQLVDQYGCLLLMRGEVVNLLNWIEAVEPYSQNYPWIAIQKGWALCLTGQPDRAEGPLQTAGQLISSLEPNDDVQTMAGAISAARAYRANLQGDTRLAADLARHSLDLLPASNDFSCSLRGAATSILGDACWIEGDLAEAQRAYSDAVEISRSAGNIHLLIFAQTNLAEALMEQGQLRQAARIYSEALSLATSPDGIISPLAERVFAGSGKIAYEWDHLEEAETCIHQSIELARRWGSIEAQAAGLIRLARLEQAQHNLEKAREAACEAERLINTTPPAPWQSGALAPALGRLWIALGDLEKASALLDTSGILFDDLPGLGAISTRQERWYLTRLHLHKAHGDDEAVLALSRCLLEKLQAENRVGRVVETLLLQALAYQGKKDTDRALAILEEAFRLARPEGFVRTFLDEGEPMAKLLFQARSQRVGSGFAAELLQAIGTATGRALPPVQALIEPLTSRELEILRRIEAGYSNQQIAAEFVISIPTVKRHISNLYAKLGTSSRTQAVARGRELNLFP